MSTACCMRAEDPKPSQQQGSIDGSIHRFRVRRMRRRTWGVSRLLPVPPRRIGSLANHDARGWRAARPPSPLPGHPLPTTGLGGREVAVAVRRGDGSDRDGTEGGAEPAVDGEGSGVVWVLGSVSVSDSRTNRKTDVPRKKQGKVVDETEAAGVEHRR